MYQTEEKDRKDIESEERLIRRRETRKDRKRRDRKERERQGDHTM